MPCSCVEPSPHRHCRPAADKRSSETRTQHGLGHAVLRKRKRDVAPSCCEIVLSFCLFCLPPISFTVKCHTQDIEIPLIFPIQKNDARIAIRDAGIDIFRDLARPACSHMRWNFSSEDINFVSVKYKMVCFYFTLCAKPECRFDAKQCITLRYFI